MRLMTALMAAVATTAFAVDPSQDPTADYVLDGPTIFRAASGATVVYSGLISGTGPAIIAGGGTVAFSHANNTYSGGTLVSNAVFRLDADGCAGSAGITGAVNTAHVYMNCANVPNEMRFLGIYGADAASSTHTAYPKAGVRPLYPLASTVTVGGKVSFLEGSSFGTVYNAGYNGDGAVNSTVTFLEDFTCDTGKMHISTYGKTIFKKKFGAPGFTGYGYSYIGYNASGSGTLELHSPSNHFTTIALYNPSIYLKAKDALANAILYYRNGGSCKTYLCGNDQTFRGFTWPADTYKDRPNITEASTGHFLSSADDPATVRIIGFPSNKLSSVESHARFVNKIAVKGKITLVMDVDPDRTATGFFQDFSVRKSTTTGDLIISNGDFRVSGTASFPNVPNIYVGTGGTFACNSEKSGTFSSCTNLIVEGTMTFADYVSEPFAYKAVSLTLGESGRLSLPSGYRLVVRSLKIGDDEMPEGVLYGEGGTPCDQIAKGSVIVIGAHEAVEKTWTGGGGADTSMATAANWGSAEAPDLLGSSLVATFASGGTMATSDSDVFLRSMSLSKSDTGFTFGGVGAVTVEGGVSVAKPAEGQMPVYDFLSPLRVISAQTLTFPSNATFKLSGGSYFPFDMVKNGEGDFVIAGSNVWNGKMIVRDSNVRILGTITSSKGVDGASLQTNKTKVDTESAIYLHMDTYDSVTPKSTKASTCIISNAVVERPFQIRTANVGARNKFQAAPASTNRFRSFFLSADQSNNGIVIPEGSEVHYEGGGAFIWSFYQSGTGTSYFRGKSVSMTSSDYGYTLCGGGTSVFEIGGNTVRGLTILENGGTYDFRVNNVLAGSATLRMRPLNSPPKTGAVLHLNSTSQTIYSVQATDTSGLSYIDGDGATLFITNNVTTNSIFRIPFKGSVSLRVNMPGAAILSHAASTSTGSIHVERGTVRFEKTASWTNVSEVVASGTGRIEIQAESGETSRPVFGKQADLSLSGSGVISLPNGASVRVRSLCVDGQPQPNGNYRYDSISNPAVKAHFDPESTGTLCVRGIVGFAISIR